MDSCIFCQIVQGLIPAAKLYESDHVLSFLDINPINHGHALVIPKKHYATIFEIAEEDLLHTVSAARTVASAIKQALSCEGVNLVQNNLRAAGQLIDHFHIHVIPRFEGDGFLTSWPGKPYREGAIEEVREAILRVLNRSQM